MRRILLKAIVGLIFSFFITGCELINPPEEIPTYIYIDSIKLDILDPSEGSAAHKILDAWVFIDNNPVGIYELPINFPVLNKGEVDILVQAGIAENGIASTRVNYPFYTSYKTTVTLSEGETITINPVVNYKHLADFAFTENFDGVGIKFSRLNGNVDIVKSTEEKFEGVASGKIELTGVNNYAEIGSTESFPLPLDGSLIYLELNYKGTNDFQIGLLDENSQQRLYDLVVYPKEDWNKIYVNLTQIANVMAAQEFRLVIQSVLNEELASSEIYIDNVKLIH